MSGAVATVLIFLLLGAALAFIWWFIDPRATPCVEYTQEMPTWNFSFRTFAEGPKFDRTRPKASSQTADWLAAMRETGEAMQQEQLRSIYFVHGTFAGTDPLGLIETLKTIFPNINKRLASRIRKLTKKNTDLLLRDTGNFTEDYINIFSEAIGGKIPCHRFNWSSENHHAARLRAAARLAVVLAEEIRARKLEAEDHILLVGHSHGGQLFALLAQLLEYEQFGYLLLEVLKDMGENLLKLNAALSTIRTLTLDFVTLGTPVMYTWPDSGYYRLLHIVNHRGSSHRAGMVRSGILYTRDGDYVQQLAILGTDHLGASAQDRVHNRRLDEIFGSGRNLRAWRKNVAKRMRISPSGKTFLVDYLDGSQTMPNFVKTFFGHGFYTRYEAIIFNTRLITEYFYIFHQS